MRPVQSIYLDHAAATPVRSEVRSAMLPYLSNEFGNPSSFTSLGARAAAAVSTAREEIANLLGARAEEIIFTGSGTESINLALRGIGASSGAHLVTSTIEHEAVLATIRDLESSGTTTTYVPVFADGRLDLERLNRAIQPDTRLVSIMYANNEIGTVQPLTDISRLVRRHNRTRRQANRPPIYVHSDACQAPGYLDVTVDRLRVDLLSLNAAKIGGPKGVGLLYIRRGTPIRPILTGGGQEFGRRAGTENVAGIIGLATALRLAHAERAKEAVRIGRLRDQLLLELQSALPDLVVHGSLAERLPNNLSLGFPGLDGEALALYLDEEGVIVGTGSACSSQTLTPSHVLVAIGQATLALATIRVSLGRTTTVAAVHRAAAIISRRVAWLRATTASRV